MKRLLLLLIGGVQLSCAMDLTEEAIAGAPKPAATMAREKSDDKEKARMPRVPTGTSSSSAASDESDSSSSDQMKVLDKKIILRTLELDAKTITILEDRLAQYESNAVAAKRETREKTSQEDKKKNRLSVVYMPPLPKLDLSHPKSSDDAEQGISKLSDEDYAVLVDHYAQETGRNLAQVKGKLIEVLKKKVETPPATPDSANAAQAILTYRKASVVHATAKTELTARKTSPVTRGIARNGQAIEPRASTVAEVIEHELGGDAGAILTSISNAVDEAFNQKLTDAKSTQQKTTGGGALATVIGAVVSGVVTYAVTKSKC